MRLIVSPIYTEVEADFIELQLLSEMLVAPDSDGDSHSLFENNRFYTGLLPRIEELFQSRDMEYEVEWTYEPQRRNPRDIDIPIDFLPGIELRAHQIAAAQKVIAAGGRGVVNVGTGGGKTEIAVIVAKYLGVKSLFLNSRVNAMTQSAARFNKYGVECGRLGGEHRELGCQVTSAVVDSIVSGLRRRDREMYHFLSQVQLIVFDEVHHLSSDTWNTIGENCPAWGRIGLSASAFLDPEDRYYEDMLLIGQTGEVVCHVPPRYLINKKLLAEPFIHWFSINTERPDTYDWTQVYTHGVVNNNYLNYLTAGFARHARNLGYKVLILVQRIDHGRRLLNLIEDPTVPFSYGGGKVLFWGEGKIKDYKIDPERLRETFEKMPSGIMIGNQVYDEAIDLPSMNFLVMAGGGRSFRRTVQRIGRPLHSRDDLVHVIEFWMYNHPYLQKHSKERAKIYGLPDYEYRMFSGTDELNRHLAVPVDPQRILWEYHQRSANLQNAAGR